MESVVMVTLMRKRGTSDFVIPLQIDTPMLPVHGALGRYNVNSFAVHMPVPPKYDIGFQVDFATLESRQLTMKEILAVDTLRMLAEGGSDAPRAKLRMMKRELRRLQKTRDGVGGTRWLASLMRRAASRS